ncbi:uncharacterized protein LOC133785377 isoform X2 [Humulus lupulus]|nr:uncharacterized protein LOC133785377 isoform X2 [Humulus lupulus]XP_062080615.1 uncharacterized protein LOC133785377 isoform X2 [Humulus lupulus]
MAIDKSWTTLRNRGCQEYWNGLQAFLRMASEHKDSDGRIRCPCVRCINNRLESLDVVQAHVFDKGFHQAYEKWIYHGEEEEIVANEVADENEDDEMIHVVEDSLLPTTEEVETDPGTSQSQHQSEGSGNESSIDSSPADQHETLNKVLVEKSDYRKGVGYRVKGKGRMSTSSSTNQSQSPAHTAPTLHEDMTTMALMMKAMRETIQMRTPQQSSSLYNPRFDSFLQRYLPSQSKDGTSSQSNTAHPDLHTPPQQQYQPPPQYPPYMSSQQPLQYQNQYMFGRSSQSHPLYCNFTDFTGGSMQHPQPNLRYGEVGGPSQQQPFSRYGELGGSSQQQTFFRYGEFGGGSQQQEQPFLSTPIHPRPRDQFGDLALGQSSQQHFIPSLPQPLPQPQPPPPPPPQPQPQSPPHQNVEDDDN